MGKRGRSFAGGTTYDSPMFAHLDRGVGIRLNQAVAPTEEGDGVLRAKTRV